MTGRSTGRSRKFSGREWRWAKALNSFNNPDWQKGGHREDCPRKKQPRTNVTKREMGCPVHMKLQSMQQDLEPGRGGSPEQGGQSSEAWDAGPYLPFTRCRDRVLCNAESQVRFTQARYVLSVPRSAGLPRGVFRKAHRKATHAWLVLGHSKISCCPSYSYFVWAQVWVLTALLSTQLPTNVPVKVAEDDPGIWAAATHVGILGGEHQLLVQPGSDPVIIAFWWVNQWTETHFLSLSLSLLQLILKKNLYA